MAAALTSPLLFRKKPEAVPETEEPIEEEQETEPESQTTEEAQKAEPVAPATVETQTAEPEPVITVTVVPEPVRIADPSLSADEGVYSLSEAISVPSGASIEIADLSQILSAEMIAALNNLTIDEQVSVLLSVLDTEASMEFSQSMLDAAEKMKAWFDSLTSAEKEAFLRRFRAPVENITARKWRAMSLS